MMCDEWINDDAYSQVIKDRFPSAVVRRNGVGCYVSAPDVSSDDFYKFAIEQQFALQCRGFVSRLSDRLFWDKVRKWVKEKPVLDQSVDEGDVTVVAAVG